MWTVTLVAVDPATPATGRAGGVPAAKVDPAAILVPAALLAIVLLAGAVALVVADRWRKRDRAGTDAAESLTDFRGMYERGELTEAEYAKLRDRLAAKLKRDGPNFPPRAAPPPPPPPDPSVPPPTDPA